MLETRLAAISSLIRADTPFRVFYTAHGGFDTHSAQLYTHRQLLETVGKTVAGFLEWTVAATQRGVVVLIFSEFGRRLQENASQDGTHHGTAPPALVAGSAVKGGCWAGPSLADLDETGDPRFTVDFRDVYGALLHKWLDVPP